MDFGSMIEALRLKQKKAAPKVEPVYKVVVRYNPFWKEWDVNRYDADGIELQHERHQLQGAARYIATTWMDMFNVSQIVVFQMDGKVKEVIQRQNKEAS